jgi:inner membrane protease ATP23
METEKEEKAKVDCELNILQALKTNSKVKLLITAMNNAGCKIVPHRHLVCEPCNNKSLSGGYDQAANQIVICSNVCKSPEKVEEILTHELIHMYDICTAKLDLTCDDHLACTEIRAANLAHCSSPSLDYFWSHKACVQGKAANSHWAD